MIKGHKYKDGYKDILGFIRIYLMDITLFKEYVTDI